MQYRNLADVELGIDRIIAAFAKDGAHKTPNGMFTIMTTTLGLGYAFDSDIPIDAITKLVKSKLEKFP
jgi:hypothetical protein